MSNVENNNPSQKRAGWWFEKNENHPNPLGRLPRWQQWLIFFIIFFIVIFAQDYIREKFRGSDEANRIKDMLKPMAKQLETAEKTGDVHTVILLFKPTSDLLNTYNQLSKKEINAINNSSLRYCVLAAVYLSRGTGEVYNSGYWISKDQYKNAFELCK